MRPGYYLSEFDEYDWWSNNCEHYVTYVLFGDEARESRSVSAISADRLAWISTLVDGEDQEQSRAAVL